MKHRTKKWLVVVILTLGLMSFLSSCSTGALSVDVDLSLYKAEKWKIQLELVFSHHEYQLAGAQINKWIEETVSEWNEQGINAKYYQRVRKDENVAYLIKANGQGYAKLNQSFFSGMASIVVDKNADSEQVYFQYLPWGEFFGAALSRTFVLHGSNIIASNGVQSGKNTTTWVNPVGVMEATITPKQNIQTFLLAGALIGLLLIIVYSLRKTGKKRCPHCGAAIPKKAEFCTVCGSMLESNGYFQY